MFGTTKTGGLLHDEHHSTLGALNALTRLVIETHPPAIDGKTRPILEEVARALYEDVTDHFGFEETNLFPTLHQAGATFMVDMLTQEHADIRELVESVRGGVLQALENGRFEAQDWPEFAELAKDLIDRETFHIQKEEMGLLAALSQILTPAQDAAVAKLHPKWVG